jgi:mono/diheme cytochrome c family protein
MKLRYLLVPALFCVVSAPASTAGNMIDLGKKEYLNSCAVCHGADGKARTPAADFLKTVPADLSGLAKRNGGVFPIAKVYETIDGRQDVKAHGNRDMPIWGQRYTVEAAPGYDDYPHNAEIYVRSRILSLIDYLYRLQVK